jgi:hypothetical protein
VDGHDGLLGDVLEAGVGFVRGAAASVSFGAVGAPKSSDSLMSLYGQSMGTAMVADVGREAMVTGGGQVMVGLAGALETDGLSLSVSGTGALEAIGGATVTVGAAKNAGAILNAMAGKGKGVEPYNRKEQYGNTSSSQAAKDARAAGEGKPCPKCGKTQTSGGPNAPQAEHQPTLKKHWFTKGNKMSPEARRAYARSKGSLKGTLCKTCQAQQGGLEKNKAY